jgi:hypothetical protein
MLRGFPLVVLLLVMPLAQSGVAQTPTSSTADTLRVTVSQNNDGSRTTYETDPANRKAVATTTSAAGEPLGKIRYVLDEAGRYESGSVFGPNDRLQFKTLYKYDDTGRLLHETRLTKDDAVTMRIVYAYDQAGRQAGYSVFDAEGRLLGKTTPKGAAPPPAPSPTKSRR